MRPMPKTSPPQPDLRPTDGAVEAGAEAGLDVPPRSPTRAAIYAALLPGAGQVYNKQLEKAVLLWIWGAILLGVGVLLLLLGLLGRFVPPNVARPPLGDWIAENAGGVTLVWLLAAASLWAVALRDAYVSAGRINRREVLIRHGMRRQMVHVLGSQLLGFIPLVGLFFPPAVVAEAIDAVHHKRGPDRRRLVREGGQALLEWALTRAAVYGLGILTALWALWWLLRGAGMAP